jgi:hypothetical protein
MSYHNIETYKDGLRIRGKDYVKDIKSLGVSASDSIFQLKETLNLNPGDQEIFQWIKPFTLNYDFWYPFAVKICLKPKWIPSDNGEQVGNIYIGFDHDVTDSPPSNGRTIKQSGVNHAEGHIYDTIEYHVDCRSNVRTSELMQVVHTPITANSDKRHAYLGQCFIATDNLPASVSSAAVSLFELWIEYDIGLTKKQETQRSAFPKIGQWIGTAPTTANPIGTNVKRNPSNTIGDVTFSNSTSPNELLVTFPDEINQGAFCLFYWADVSAGTCAWTTTNSVNIEAIEYIHQGTQFEESSTAGKIFSVCFVKVTGPGATIGLDSNGITSGVVSELHIIETGDIPVTASGYVSI